VTQAAAHAATREPFVQQSVTKCTPVTATLHSSLDLTSLQTLSNSANRCTLVLTTFICSTKVLCRPDTCRIVLLLVTDWSLCTVAFQNDLHSFLGWEPESAVGVADRYGVQIRVGKYIFLNGYRSSFPGYSARGVMSTTHLIHRQG